jgi:hypothetical protein
LITGTTTGILNFATGITTGTLNQMTAQTTGNFILGGNTATGAINIGRSTANQSIVIGTGITASGNVKTVNIGTLGASGSNTNVIIGSVTSGAQTNITLYGNTAAGNLSTTGQISATGDIVSAGNIAALNFNSTFADLAEMYSADAAYAPGVVVSFGGSNEITLSGNVDPRVAGVISTNPSYTMNTAIEATHVVTVALTGRVPTRVTGLISKGDLMISADGGRAQAWVGNVSQPYPIPGTVFGKALSNHGGGEGVIEVVIGRY